MMREGEKKTEGRENGKKEEKRKPASRPKDRRERDAAGMSGTVAEEAMRILRGERITYCPIGTPACETLPEEPGAETGRREPHTDATERTKWADQTDQAETNAGGCVPPNEDHMSEGKAGAAEVGKNGGFFRSLFARLIHRRKQ